MDKKAYPRAPNDLVAYAARDEELVVTDPSRNVLGVMDAVRIHPRKKVTPPPPPPPPPVDPDDIPGWGKPVFVDQFTTWDPTRYDLYPTDQMDTYNKGWRNSAGGISSDGTKLRCHIFVKDGMGEGCHFVPLLPGGPNKLALRIEYRFRADILPGFKDAHLLWPLSGIWPRDGEGDNLEGWFDGTPPSAFLHYQNGTSVSDQKWLPYPMTIRQQDWHTYRLEWIAGVSFEPFVDGGSIGKVTERVPNTPMHWVFQNETNGSALDPATSGYLELDYLKVWTR